MRPAINEIKGKENKVTKNWQKVKKIDNISRKWLASELEQQIALRC